MGYSAIDIADFSGGLNTKASPGTIADNEYSECLNVYLDDKGIAKRKGYERYFYDENARIDEGQAGMGIIHAPFINGEQIVGVAGGKIAYKSLDTWADITGSVTITPNYQSLFTIINNVLVGVNGNDPALYYTGSDDAVTLSGENIPTAPTACETFHGRLFLSEGRRLAWSGYMGDWNKPFTPDNEQYFESAITGLMVLGSSGQSYMYVFTKQSIHICIFDPTIGDAVGGSGTFRFDQISNMHGCISPYSIRECYTDSGVLILIWADSDGLKAMTGDNNIVKISEKIQPNWDTLNADKLDISSAIYYKPKRWYIFLCNTGISETHDSVIIYDLRYGCIVGIFDLRISSMGIIRKDGVEKLIGSDYDGYWNMYDTGDNDNDVAINSYFITKEYDGGSPYLNKTLKAIELNFSYYGDFIFNITAYFNHAGAFYTKYTTTHVASSEDIPIDDFKLDQDTLSAVGQLAIQSEEMRGLGRTIQFKIENNEINEPFRIHRILGVYQPGRTVLYI